MVGAISKLVGVLRQTSCPAVAAASAGITAAIVGATSSVTAVSTVVVTHYVAAAVMRMRHHLVRHVFPARAKQLLQPDDGRDDQSDFPAMAAIAPNANGNRAAALRARAIISGPRIFWAFSVKRFVRELYRVSGTPFSRSTMNENLSGYQFARRGRAKSLFLYPSKRKKERKKDCFSFSVSRGTTTISLFWMITI